MTAPPGREPNQKPTGGHVSETAASQAASAIRRAGFDPTPRNVRVVLRADRDMRREGYEPTSAEDFEWWDRLVRLAPVTRQGRRNEDAAVIAKRQRWQANRGLVSA